MDNLKTRDSRQLKRPHRMGGFPVTGAFSLGVIFLLSCAAGARGQSEEQQVVEVDPGREFPTTLIRSALSATPQNLPGHTKGDRSPEDDEDADDSAAREWFGDLLWLQWSRITGTWDGFRTQLSEAGISFEGSYTLDWSNVIDGGVMERSSSRHLVDANLTFDLDTLAGIEGATVFVDLYSTHGNIGSADAGDFQGISNIETDIRIDQIAELWYEQSFVSDTLRLKIGKVEANSEFAFVDAAGEFINSSGGFSPTIFTLPTYPDPAMSVNLFVYPTEHMYFGFGLYDGATAVDGVPTGSRGPSSFFSSSLSDDYFYVSELGFTWDELGSWASGRVAVGGWYHDGVFSPFAGGTDTGTGGFYWLCEQQLTTRADNDELGLWVFAQYGYADKNVSEAEHHIGAGLSLMGTFSGRDDDAAGVYVSHVVLSDEPAAGFATDETVVELFYKYQLTPFVSIKPDLQCIFNPSGDSTLDDAVVGMLRVEITF